MTASPSKKHVLIGVCGGIAAYKVCSVASSLVQDDCDVTVAMTDAATRFVTPLTFKTITGRPVFTSLWQADDYDGQQHIHLSEQADLFLIAPTTANMLAKLSHGMADDLISTMVLAAACPVLLAPAMNTRMWQNSIVQANVSKLVSLGYAFVEPQEGWLSCRVRGVGRLAEPEQICAEVKSRLSI